MQALVQTLLQTYLLLTPAQSEAFKNNEQTFFQWRLPRVERQIAVTDEILKENTKDPVDPLALGLRYAEVEAIRREISERELALVATNRQLLTDPQRLRLQALEEARRLAPTVSEAETARLFPPSAAPMFGLLLAANRFDGFGGIPGSSVDIADYLQLSSEQRRAYYANLDDFNQWQTTQQFDIRRWRQSACTAMSASPLDPIAIGTPWASIATTERQITLRHTALVDANRGLLNPDQRARLDLLAQARALAQPLRDAEAGGFFPSSPASPPDSRWFNVGSFITVPINSCVTTGLPSPIEFSPR